MTNELSAALRPFTVLLQEHKGGEDDEPIFGIITLGDLRRVVAAGWYTYENDTGMPCEMVDDGWGGGCACIGPVLSESGK